MHSLPQPVWTDNAIHALLLHLRLRYTYIRLGGEYTIAWMNFGPRESLTRASKENSTTPLILVESAPRLHAMWWLRHVGLCDIASVRDAIEEALLLVLT
jgi:hypothetical protein